MTARKISFFVDDLATNAIVRAGPIAAAARHLGYDIEIIGFLRSGSKVYEPYRCAFEYKTIRVSGSIRAHLRTLAALAQGDIIYACKPLLSTLVPAAYAAKAARWRPLILDVEDDEFWMERFSGKNWDLRKMVARWWCLRSTYAAHAVLPYVDATTVVSTTLKARYGGTIVLHGPDETNFDPEKPELAASICKQHFGLGSAPSVLFAGIPHPHKGLGVLVDALQSPGLRNVQLVLAGPSENTQFRRASKLLVGRVRTLGVVANEAMPRLLAAADIVPTPQLDNEFTQAQVPAKLLEAMAMKKCVIASRVSDLPAILGEDSRGARGWLHDPGSVSQLATCIRRAIDDPVEAERRARRARQWFLQNASNGALSNRLHSILRNVECLSEPI